MHLFFYVPLCRNEWKAAPRHASFYNFVACVCCLQSWEREIKRSPSHILMFIELQTQSHRQTMFFNTFPVHSYIWWISTNIFIFDIKNVSFACLLNQSTTSLLNQNFTPHLSTSLQVKWFFQSSLSIITYLWGSDVAGLVELSNYTQPSF